MDKDKMIEYLEMVVDLEKQAYLQKRTIISLDEKIASMGNHSFVPVPEKASDENQNALGFTGAVIGLACSLIIAAIIYYVTDNAAYSILSGVILCIIGGCIGLYVGDKKDYIAFKNNKETAEAMNEHTKLLLLKEKREKELILAERWELFEQFKRTRQILQQYYDLNILYGKYHDDFPAVASFLDYFKSGRCSTLGENRGGDGAYNLYESELLQHRIIDRIDTIIERLEDVKSNQWTIYSAIQEGNNISRQLVSATEQLAASAETTAQNSAIAAYNAQQAANEAYQIKWLELYKIH